ncbi:MAG: HAD hydrolase-like protein [Treponema sp.]|nr:HAD hydrolase-like protein [Treponema sp.]
MDKIDTIIFDLDGTLLDTLEDIKDSLNKTYAELGVEEKSLSQVRASVGNGMARLVELTLVDGKKNPLYEKAVKLTMENYASSTKPKTKPYDGILETMEELKKLGYKCAIVSNKPDPQVKELQAKYFTSVSPQAAIGEIAGIPRKPAPDSVWKAIEILGSKKENSIYIGDSEVDIKTAVNSGLPSISVTWGFRDRELLIENGAERFADRPQDIIEILRKLNDTKK